MERSREREAAALVLRCQGLTSEEIGIELAYENSSGAFKAVRRGMDRIGMEEAQEALALNYERYNHVISSLWDRVGEGDLAAIAVVLRTMDEINWLAGLTR
jgi:hypothetical protein